MVKASERFFVFFCLFCLGFRLCPHTPVGSWTVLGRRRSCRSLAWNRDSLSRSLARWVGAALAPHTLRVNHKPKWGLPRGEGVGLQPLVCPSVRPSVRPSVCPSVRLSLLPSIDVRQTYEQRGFHGFWRSSKGASVLPSWEKLPLIPG